ncbi:hypothetical protein PGTUg99_017790 [Puccinia graminis f. sp. tritici]|uniref:Uncharacterized protein n=1 Tax=Puccinia graminis f. sp. tritici TaxID=56615 RepID=A0A5B0RBM2_PUCGR|nr:hypothetical protein PGTUg99_017790 [Puccinia graminis f. sp. tritici]
MTSSQLKLTPISEPRATNGKDACPVTLESRSLKVSSSYDNFEPHMYSVQHEFSTTPLLQKKV